MGNGGFYTFLIIGIIVVIISIAILLTSVWENEKLNGVKNGTVQPSSLPSFVQKTTSTQLRWQFIGSGIGLALGTVCIIVALFMHNKSPEFGVATSAAASGYKQM